MTSPRIFILGGTSAIAQAYARLRGAEGAGFVLLGRHADRLRAVAKDLEACGARQSEIYATDLADIAAIESTLDVVLSQFGKPDEVLIAYGALGVQANTAHDLAAARDIFDVNFTSAALWVLGILKRHENGVPLTIVGIGSVAGDRGRASNFTYGSAKAGFARFLEGLAQKYDGTGVHIITVKPGLVDTPMTAAFIKQGPLWATPERIARDMQRGVVRNQRVIYTPSFWWVIMMIIRHLPWFVFKRLKV
jgi:short-subunit dehydrogenase